jgi:NTE family protein
VEIEKIARKYSSIREMMKLVDITPYRKGIIVSQRLHGFLSRFIDPDINIENVQIPLFMNAVNLFSGEEVVLDKGNLLNSILATTAIPGFFSPFEKDDVALIDGGIVDNLPISIMRKKSAQPMVAVDVHHTNDDFSSLQTLLNPFPKTVFPGLVREYYLAELIRMRKLTDLQLLQDAPELLMYPKIDPHISLFFGFQRVDELIRAGEIITLENENNLRKLVA